MTAGTDLPSSSRALVVVSTPAPAAKPHAHRTIERAAPFLAHLIAGAQKAPQARERRKADPAEVIAAYRDTIARIRAA